jgi:hypothetical protein
MLNHCHYRRWYRTTTQTDFCCFHLQLNQHLTAFLQRHKHKEKKELPVWEHTERLHSHVRPQTPVTYEQDNCRANTPTDRQEFVPIRLRMRQLPCQYAYGQTRIRANTPTNMTPLLALHCHPNDPVAGTVLLPTQTMIVLICMRSIEQPIVPIRLRSTDRTIAPIRL